MSRYRCPYCWKTGNRRTLAWDHIIPKSRNGCDCSENMVEACRECNRRKKDKTPLEFFVWLADIEHFDYWGFHHATRRKLLEDLVKLEFDARKHLKQSHRVQVTFAER